MLLVSVTPNGVANVQYGPESRNLDSTDAVPLHTDLQFGGCEIQGRKIISKLKQGD